MKKIVSFSFSMALLLLAVKTFAADQNFVYQKFCQPLTFTTDRQNCVNIIRKYTYFKESALDICAPMTFTSEQFKCLDSVGNKTYMDFEITECDTENFESQKISCLARSGTSITNGGSLDCKLGSTTEQLFKSMLFDLRSGNSRSVDAQLQQLIEKSKNCP